MMNAALTVDVSRSVGNGTFQAIGPSSVQVASIGKRAGLGHRVALVVGFGGGTGHDESSGIDEGAFGADLEVVEELGGVSDALLDRAGGRGVVDAAGGRTGCQEGRCDQERMDASHGHPRAVPMLSDRPIQSTTAGSTNPRSPARVVPRSKRSRDPQGSRPSATALLAASR